MARSLLIQMHFCFSVPPPVDQKQEDNTKARKQASFVNILTNILFLQIFTS